MWKVLENAFDFYIRSLLYEGENYLKIKGLIISLEALKGFRKLLFLILSYIFIFVLFVFSLFSTAFLLFNQYQNFGFINFNLTLAFHLAFLFISVFSFFYITRECYWLKIFGLSKLVTQRQNDSKKEQHTKNDNRLNQSDLQDIANVLDEVIENKVQQVMQQMQDLPR